MNPYYIARSVFWRMPQQLTHFVQTCKDDRHSHRKIYRPYFDSTESIYIHIPKVAGKSIALTLYGEDPMHHKLSMFQSIDPEKYESYFKFSFVRNPWGRIFSTYNYLKQVNQKYPYSEFFWIEKYTDFNDFIITGLDSKKVGRTLFLDTQTSYLVNLDGKIGIDYLGRFETLVEDYSKVARQLNCNKKLPTIGAGIGGTDYRPHFTDASLNKVGELYKIDIDNFEYDF